MERMVKRFGECVGSNVSKRRAGLENNNVEADLTTSQGKLPLLGKGAISTQQLHRGSGDGTYTTRAEATREAPSRGLRRETNRRPVRARPGEVGSRMGPYYRGG